MLRGMDVVNMGTLVSKRSIYIVFIIYIYIYMVVDSNFERGS